MGRMLALKPSLFCSSLSSSSFMSKSVNHYRQFQQLSFLSHFSSWYITKSRDLHTPQCQSISRISIPICSSDPVNPTGCEIHCSTISALNIPELGLYPAPKFLNEKSRLHAKFSIVPFAFKRRVAPENWRIHYRSCVGVENSCLCSFSIKPLSFAGHPTKPDQCSERQNYHSHFKQICHLHIRCSGWRAGSQLASYSTSALSNSFTRSDPAAYAARPANYPSKAGSSKRRSLAPRTYRPPSATDSAQPAQELPFEYQYTYSEIPKVAPIGFREPPFSPFGPSTLAKPWTGRGPLQKKNKKKGKEIDSFNPPPLGKKGVKPVDPPGPFRHGEAPRYARTREEVLGEPLTKAEVNELVESCNRDNRQINLGRDGLTHNMLEVIHLHWKRRRAVKIRCKGVPTVDMDNVCFHLEDKTGGKIIHRVGGTVHLFRGRNYNTKFRPKIPLMLWKPAAPIYPRLIKKVPDGLTKEEAEEMRKRGRKVQPLCKLARNGVYLNLVKDVKGAFEVDELVRIDCKGMNPSDYKKIGAKLRDMVPCVLISFEREQILMWRGRDWKSVYSTNPDTLIQHMAPTNTNTDPQRAGDLNSAEYESKLANENDMDAVNVDMSKGVSDVDKLWQQALDDGVASLLDENGHIVSACKEAENLIVMGQNSSSSFTSETELRLSQKKTEDNASGTASSPKFLPVEELAKLLAS